MKKNQQGFSLIEIMLLLFVVVLISGLGYFVWNQNNSSNQNPASQGSSNSGSNTQNSQTAATKYLEIKEWGVKFPLSDTIADAVYAPSNDTTRRMDLSTASLANTDCGVTGSATPGLYRFSDVTSSPDYDDRAVTLKEDAVKIGDYYFTYANPQAMCSEDTKVQDQASSNAAAFDDAIKHIQKI